VASQAKPVLVVDTDPPTERAILADSILKLSRGMEKLTSSGLNDFALETLLQATSKVNRTDIRAVLSALKNLERDYIRRTP